MRKIKIFLKCTILVCAVTLCGCSGEQLDKWNEVTQIPAETADGTPDIEEHYVEVCREKAKALAKKEITFQDAGEQVRYFKIQKLGDGIAVFLNSVESEDSTSDDCVVLRTQDGGNTWQMNPELLSLSHGGGELRLVENHVLIVEYNDQLESTECFVSHDYGRSFTSYSAGEVAFQSKIYPHGTFRGEIVEIDEAAKLITIAWNTESPYPSKREESNLMTAEYDFNFNLKEILKVDVDVLTYEYVSQYYPKEIFPDSDHKYLTNKDIQTLLNWTPQMVPNEKVLGYAISEIYARKGYDFTGTIYEGYFEAKNWYKNLQKKDVRKEELNDCEKANIDLLYAYTENDD